MGDCYNGDMASKEDLKRSAYSAGFDLAAVSSAAPLEEDRARYDRWRGEGYAAGMAYMVREAPRRWAPQDLLASARSVITLGVNFSSGAKNSVSRPGFGRVARYAWGKDYHEAVKARIDLWLEELRRLSAAPFESRVLVDSAPLLERAVAHRAGLGFVGKNTLLISRELGSYLFLAEVLISLDLEPDSYRSPAAPGKDECGSCRKCLDDCPTGALVAPRVLDARKCISYWTIEHKGAIPEDMRPGIGDWIFGCDLCQEVCPYVGLSRDTRWKEFLPESGAGTHLALADVLSMRDDAEFKKRFAGTPLLRAKRAGLVRNACIVAGNQRFAPVRELLEGWEGSEDEAIREHARWALRRI